MHSICVISRSRSDSCLSLLPVWHVCKGARRAVVPSQQRGWLVGAPAGRGPTDHWQPVTVWQHSSSNLWRQQQQLAATVTCSMAQARFALAMCRCLYVLFTLYHLQVCCVRLAVVAFRALLALQTPLLCLSLLQLWGVDLEQGPLTVGYCLTVLSRDS